MSPLKQEVIRIIASLPDDCTCEDIQYHRYVLDKVERSIEAVDRGEGVPEEEADRRIDEWLNSIGRH